MSQNVGNRLKGHIISVCHRYSRESHRYHFPSYVHNSALLASKVVVGNFWSYGLPSCNQFIFRAVDELSW